MCEDVYSDQTSAGQIERRLFKEELKREEEKIYELMRKYLTLQHEMRMSFNVITVIIIASFLVPPSNLTERHDVWRELTRRGQAIEACTLQESVTLAIVV